MVWPLPALGCWAVCWAVFGALRAVAVPLIVALALATLLGGVCAVRGSTRSRRALLAGGFPLSLAASGLAGSVPPWAWLLPLGVLALLYPVTAWRDAPLFPTPEGALRGLNRRVALRADARILDAGCGLGDGLQELRCEYPAARIDGVEWSWPLVLASTLRCRFASVRRADMWRADWSAYDFVYAFQRPESTERAADKAAHELRAGAWLASLEFEIRSLRPTQAMTCADGRTLWLYRAPFEIRSHGGP